VIIANVKGYSSAQGLFEDSAHPLSKGFRR
jgi:hypothetical protein